MTAQSPDVASLSSVMSPKSTASGIDEELNVELAVGLSFSDIVQMGMYNQPLPRLTAHVQPQVRYHLTLLLLMMMIILMYV